MLQLSFIRAGLNILHCQSVNHLLLKMYSKENVNVTQYNVSRTERLKSNKNENKVFKI